MKNDKGKTVEEKFEKVCAACKAYMPKMYDLSNNIIVSHTVIKKYKPFKKFKEVKKMIFRIEIKMDFEEYQKMAEKGRRRREGLDNA